MGGGAGLGRREGVLGGGSLLSSQGPSLYQPSLKLHLCTQLPSPIPSWQHEAKLINVGKPCGNVWLAKRSR